ncbi:hypothetical protein RRG08_010691 [Elysia crispata]|uniref:Acyl-coenzyme A oxidase N-terminal domain-containing protein n=1 Tax=Elysia crispata TaxID=231223 RepID=A0AAE1D6F2_9GAST|nr:hypothetical protein RRG08_010691 [Elysia crispata]
MGQEDLRLTVHSPWVKCKSLHGSVSVTTKYLQIEDHSAMAATVNPDLAHSRAQATFDPLQLTHYLYGGPEKVKRKRFIQNMAIKVYKEEGCQDFTDMTRDEAYTEALHKITVIYKKLAELGIQRDSTDVYFFREPILPFDGYPFAIHSVGRATVAQQGSESQCVKWLPLFDSFQVTGTYGQTELGHDMSGIVTDYSGCAKNIKLTIMTCFIIGSAACPCLHLVL